MDISKLIDKELHASNNLLLPSTLAFEGFPLLEKFVQQPHMTSKWMLDPAINEVRWHSNVPEYDDYYCKKALALAHATKGQVTMKMLMMYADGNEHSWQEISEKMFPGRPGKDIDCWRSLEICGMIAFSSKHARGRKYYTITDFGKEILRVLDVNDAYFKVVRWFKMDEDEMIPAMMQADLNGEESWKDIQPEAFINLLEQLFNPESEMHKLGSCYRWMNTVVRLLKTSTDFYEKMVQPKVTAWLDAHMHYYGIENFYKILDKIAECG